MIVCDFDGCREVTTIRQLVDVLNKRHEHDANSLWMSHDGEGKYPALAVLVKDDLAHVSFFPKDRDAGFSSRGNMGESLEGETTTFFISRSGEKIWVSNDAVIPFPTAVESAKEFFRTKGLPRCVEWLRL